MNDHPISRILGRLDALDAGPVEIRYIDRDGTVWATIDAIDIRAEHTVCSLAGNGDTADEAISNLWDDISGLPRTSALRIEVEGKAKRYVRWNGHAWRDVTDHFPPPAPISAEDEAVF